MITPNLFQLGTFTLASGQSSAFKIDCDVLTDRDLECIAFELSLRVEPFGSVEGVPSGGLRLARFMREHSSAFGPLLIVDDVFDTGGSIKRRSRRVYFAQ